VVDGLAFGMEDNVHCITLCNNQGLGGPEEDHQLHHCCWTGRVSERE